MIRRPTQTKSIHGTDLLIRHLTIDFSKKRYFAVTLKGTVFLIAGGHVIQAS
ncbi:Uncharacterised protein [Raoultella terrigena]|uniref:Uncharacterized protein n=1 Tax=Raoultella terrigena TaxID=577 RepID=A0A4V6J1J3_RAOTE|nr:Uncharacterised protein [Raoultella terrigena]